MAGIGFELRKLYKKEGVLNSLKAYSYSTITTVGPMLLCLFLVAIQKVFMANANVSFLDHELFIATIAYSFIFSIIITSFLSLVVTRYIADKIYEEKYEDIKHAYYGSMTILLPILAIIGALFLINVEESLLYKALAYFMFVELAIIWLQNVFISALKDYKRIFYSFLIATFVSVVVSFCLFSFTTISPVIIALSSMVVGFAATIILNSYHFERVFPTKSNSSIFDFLRYIKRYPILIFNGAFVYSSVYVHTFIYWFTSNNSQTIAGQFKLMAFYDVPVFYAYLSVLPSLIFFVVIVETNFFEGFRNYYKNITNGGTYESINSAKETMRKKLIQKLGFVSEIQLLFTTLAIAIGLIVFPKIGFSMQQLDIYIILCFSYFFFILMFILLHILMYFDDQKGILLLSLGFIITSSISTYLTSNIEYDGMGMFISSFLFVCFVFLRILHLIKNLNYYTFCPQPIKSMKQQAKSNKKLPPIVTSIFLVLLLFGCVNEETQVNPQAEEGGLVTENETLPITLTIDDKRLYERDDDTEVTNLYVTILPNKKIPTLDWYTLNRSKDKLNSDYFNIIVQEGLPDGNGLSSDLLWYNTTTTNAKIYLRGNSARTDAQKSYKIRLGESAGAWKDQTVLNLNKHRSDGSRLRNKLSFDLIENIPNITGFRTNFVNLYIKDLTSNSSEFVNYGLYTHVEQANKRFLKSHLLDPNGYLYKVKFFEFRRYAEQIKLETDPTFNKDNFETILEIQGREEHSKLIQMLDDLNNYKIPINQVVDQYFDEENILTFLATNILMDNLDSDANNYYIYSPLNSDKWLIIPWDFDGGWGLQKRLKSVDSNKVGISNYWSNLLYNRYFQVDSNVEKLTRKIEELHANYINEELVTKLINSYKHIPKKYIQINPDIEYLPIRIEDYDAELEYITNTIASSLEGYYKDLQKPKPFFQHNYAELIDGSHLFMWDHSYDFQANTIYYTITIATDPALTNIVAHEENLRGNQYKTDNLTSGVYYMKVVATDSEGNFMTAFDQFSDPDTETIHYGVIEVTAE